MQNKTKTCRQCQSEINKKAKKCPHCGSRVYGKGVYRFLYASLGLFVLIILLIAVFGGNDESAPKTPTSQQAYIISQSFMKDELKSPSTADFPLNDFGIKELGDDRYVLTSYVDAQNSFGAEVRSEWIATVKYLGGDWAERDNWKLERLVIDGENVYP